MKKETEITDIEWHFSKTTPFGQASYPYQVGQSLADQVKYLVRYNPATKSHFASLRPDWEERIQALIKYSIRKIQDKSTPQ